MSDSGPKFMLFHALPREEVGVIRRTWQANGVELESSTRLSDFSLLSRGDHALVTYNFFSQQVAAVCREIDQRGLTVSVLHRRSECEDTLVLLQNTPVQNLCSKTPGLLVIPDRDVLLQSIPWKWSPSFGVPELTAREMQVLSGMEQGYSNPEIAKLLDIKLETVKSNARSLFGKLGANDRAEAVAIGFRLGLLQ